MDRLRSAMDAFTQWLRDLTTLSSETQIKVVASALSVLTILVARRVVLRLAVRRSDDVRVIYLSKKISTYIAFGLSAFTLGWIWLRGFSAISTYLGLLSAGLAIALKDPLVNLAGWIFILTRRPFAIGDRVQIGAFAGDVIDIRIFQFTLMEIGNWVDADQSTGRVIHVPNGALFTESLANYTKGFQHIWNEIPVLVTFESNWEKAKSILQDIADARTGQTHAAREHLRRAASRFMIFYENLDPIVYTSVVDSGVMLTIRYLCPPRQRRGSMQVIWEDILREFGACDDIDFAYPTRRFFDNASEGKAGLKPSDS